MYMIVFRFVRFIVAIVLSVLRFTPFLYSSFSFNLPLKLKRIEYYTNIIFGTL